MSATTTSSAVKLNGAEYGVPEGTTSEECQQFAKWLEAASSDYFNIVADGYGPYGRIAIAEQLSYPEAPKPIIKELASIDFKQGMNVHLAAAVKKVVSVPVIAVGKLDAPLGEKFISEGKCDAVAIGRRLFADPEYPNKAYEGREDDVRPCTSCITCETRMVEYDGVRCQVNAALGRGSDNERFVPARQGQERSCSGRRSCRYGGGPGDGASRASGDPVRERSLPGRPHEHGCDGEGHRDLRSPRSDRVPEGPDVQAWRQGEAWRGILCLGIRPHQA